MILACLGPGLADFLDPGFSTDCLGRAGGLASTAAAAAGLDSALVSASVGFSSTGLVSTGFVSVEEITGLAGMALRRESTSAFSRNFAESQTIAECLEW